MAGGSRVKGGRRAQSAMEYLMTYGWAILIIVVVVAVLFKLGLFSANTFTSRAQPGACQVEKPYGPNTTQLLSLSGVCEGSLPEFVAQFNGISSYVSPKNPISGLDSNTMPFTISLWIKPTQNISVTLVNEQGSNPPTVFSGWPLVSLNAGGDINSYTWHCTGNGVVKENVWSNVAITYNGVATRFYVNGVLEDTDTGARSSNGGSYLSIGAGSTSSVCGDADAAPGYYANYQLYNTSLSAEEIQTLYIDGIGGSPVNVQDLLEWLPLNGNGNDYSGNGNNGKLSGVTFTNSWTTGYTPP